MIKNKLIILVGLLIINSFGCLSETEKLVDSNSKSILSEVNQKSSNMWSSVFIRPVPPRSLENVTLTRGLGISGIGLIFSDEKPEALVQREEIYQKGEVVYAKIIEKSVNKGFFRNTYKIVLEIESLSGKKIKREVSSSSEDIHNTDKEKIIGLEYNENFLFGEELEVTYELYVIKEGKE